MRCLICGEPHRACGPRTSVQPVGVAIIQQTGRHVSLRIYEYELAGVKITAQLNEADAAMLNAVPVEETTQPQTERAPARKTRVPQNKARTNG